jgi:hypothetical protein
MMDQTGALSPLEDDASTSLATFTVDGMPNGNGHAPVFGPVEDEGISLTDAAADADPADLLAAGEPEIDFGAVDFGQAQIGPGDPDAALVTLAGDRQIRRRLAADSDHDDNYVVSAENGDELFSCSASHVLAWLTDADAARAAQVAAVADVRRAVMTEPREKLAQPDEDGDGLELSRLPPPPQCRWPEQVWSARPRLKAIREAAYGRLANPEAVAAAVLNCLGVLSDKVGMRMPAVGGRHGQPGEFNGLITGPGGGKGIVLETTRELVPVPLGKVAAYKLDAQLGSAEGLAAEFFAQAPPEPGKKGGAKQVRAFDGVLLSLDEGAVLEGQADRSRALLETMSKGWSGEVLGFGYADDAKRRVVPAFDYAFGINMSTQMDRVTAWLSPGSKGQGLGHRFFWMALWTPEMPQVDLDALTDAELEALIEPLDPLDVAPAAAPMTCAPALIRLVRGFRQKDAATFHGGADFDGQRGMLLYKRAANLARLENRSQIQVNDWELAELMLASSVATRGWMLDWIKAGFIQVKDDEGWGDAHRARSKATTLTRMQAQQLAVLGYLERHRGRHLEGGCSWQCVRSMVSKPSADGRTVSDLRMECKVALGGLVDRRWVIQTTPKNRKGPVYVITDRGLVAALDQLSGEAR